MLAHLEDFNFAPLLEHFDVSHILFLDLLDGNFLGVLPVNSKLNKTELTLAKSLFQVVELEDI